MENLRALTCTKSVKGAFTKGNTYLAEVNEDEFKFLGDDTGRTDHFITRNGPFGSNFMDAEAAPEEVDTFRLLCELSFAESVE